MLFILLQHIYNIYKKLILLMTNMMHLLSIFVIAGILTGSIAVSTSVFATYDKEAHRDQNGLSSSNANLYVNSLEFDFNAPNTLDSCSVISPPCILLNPLNSPDRNEVFISDPALLNTRTLITVNVNEQDNFPTNSTISGINDIFAFPECYIVTLAKFNGINGVFIECNAIDNGIIDVTYSFIDPHDDDDKDYDHDDDKDNDHDDKSDHGKSNYKSKNK